jgi:hypothetical protein
MPPATHRISLLSASCLATVTHVPTGALVLPGRSAASLSLSAVSLASGLVLVAPAPADAAIIYSVGGKTTGTMGTPSGNTLTTTATGGNPSSVTLQPLSLTNILVGTSVSTTVLVDNIIDSKLAGSNRSVTFSFTSVSSGVTVGSNGTFSVGGNRNVSVTATPTVRGTSVAGSFTIKGSSPGVAVGNVGRSSNSDTTNVTINVLAVSAEASQTASTTIYALPGKTATQVYTVQNIGDGTKAGADSETVKSELWGSTSVTKGTSWSGSALTFNTEATNLTDTKASTDSLSTTFTYTGATTRGSSDTATIAATYTSGGTKNAGSTATTVLTGTTVAPVNSTTATNTTLYALPGQKASGTFSVTNVGDGSYAGASLTGTLTTTVTTGFSGSVGDVNFNLADGKAPSTPAATTLTQTMTYTGQATRSGASVAATVTASFTNGHTDGNNASQTITKVFTGQTVAPVQSVTTGGANVYALPGQTVTRDFTIANTGDGSLVGATLNGTTSNTLGGGFASVTATGSFALNDGVTGPAASTLTHTVSYVGQSTRGTTSTATVTAAFSNGSSAGTNASQTVTQTFKAQVVAPVSSTTAAPTTLGPVRVGTSTTGSVTVKNIGDGNLAGADNGTTLLTNLRGNVSVSGSTAITGGGAVNLTDSSSQTYMFTYAPTARGTQSATITTAFTNGSVDGKNMASTASSTVTGTAVGPDFDAVVAGKNASSGAIINGGTILFGDAVGGLTLQDLLISNLSNDAASKALTDLTLTNVTITGSTEFSFSLSGFDSPDTGFSTSTKNAVLSNLYNGDGSGSIAIQFVNKAGTGAAQLRIETDEGAALGGPGAIYVYNLIWTVPEPGTIAVFGAGLLGLAISRQRRRGRAFVALTAKPDEDKAPSAG